MKKFFLTTTFVLLGMASCFAAKANHRPYTVVQSDGTTLTIYQHGDEHFHWTTAEDGTLLVPVGKYYYVAQVENDGLLTATPQLAHNANSRSEVERKAVSLQNKEVFLSAATREWTSRAKAKASSISNTIYFPHTGTPKALVILIQFNDKKFKTDDPVTVFDYFFNSEKGTAAPEAQTNYYKGTNYGSVRQYFSDMSSGEYAPQFDVAGVVTLSKDYAYYGQDGGRGEGADIHFSEMISEACQLAKSELNVNFKDYDQDGNGKVDVVYFVYAGLGQNDGGDANTIWAKTSRSTIKINNDESLFLYTVAPEMASTPEKETGDYINGIGVFCHEFTHCLGIPDLYPTVASAHVNNQSPEYWDVMDAGEYNYNGYCPTPYSPWEMIVMDWNIDVETLDDTPKQITMNNPFGEDRKVYKIEASDGQYLLLQNYQKSGWWQKKPWHGLLIQRIDYTGEVNLDKAPNNVAGSPKVTVLPADGIIISGYLIGSGYTKDEYANSHYGDPFPGTQNVTSLTSVTLNRNVTMSNLLYNIKESDGVISFDYLYDSTSGIDRPTTDKDAAVSTDNRIFSLDGRYLGTDATTLPKGVYIIGKKKVIVK